MKRIVCLVLTLSCLGPCALAQVSPAATATGAATLVHGVQYALRYSENGQFSPNAPSIQTSDLSGSFGYANRSLQKPFATEYVGGYIWNLSGADYQSGQFHRLYISQGLELRRWMLDATDDVSYLPYAPTTGFSGIPGIGEIIGSPNPVSSNGQTILTTNTHVLSNNAVGHLTHTLNYSTSLTVGGGENLLHFPNNDGIETRGESAMAVLSRRLTGRTTIGGEYDFSDYRYPDYSITMQTNSGLAELRHNFTRNLIARVAAGPEWLTSSLTTVVPDQLSYRANASVTYARKVDSFTANYMRGITSGGGFIIGGELQDVDGNYLRQMGPNVSLGLTVGYERTSAFNNLGATNGAYGAMQSTWQVGDKLILFANFTGTGQTTTLPLPGNVLNSTLYTLSFGFGYSPRMHRVRQ